VQDATVRQAACRQPKALATRLLAMGPALAMRMLLPARRRHRLALPAVRLLLLAARWPALAPADVRPGGTPREPLPALR
jgi:hypothetical protein